MTIEQAIRKAIEGGYIVPWDFDIEFPSQTFFCDDGSIGMTGKGRRVLGVLHKEHIFLDSFFWQSLGKAMGWTAVCPGLATMRCGSHSCKQHNLALVTEWWDKWHSFIDHLAKGKSAESFFHDLK